jgi:type IV secretory pathway VirJ component
VLGAAIAIAAGLLAYIGYFGGSVFTAVPATARAPAAEQDIAAVLLSGDMGFHVGLGPQVAERLAADGISVTGVNSLTYFRVRRSPSESAGLISQAIRRALAQPGVQRVVLIGQSFGADMVNAGLPGVPEALRRRILLVTLVVPGDTIDFRASPAELFDIELADAAALPSARTLNWLPVLCIHGQVEEHSLCPLLDMPNVQRVTLPGDHYLNHDPDRVYAAIKQAIAAAAQTQNKTSFRRVS